MNRRRLMIQGAAAMWTAVAASSRLSGGSVGGRAVYRGGTLAEIEVPSKGELFVFEGVDFAFRHDDDLVRIRYDQVNLLEYGQNASHRLGLALVVSPLFLLSKKRKHYLTVGFLGDSGEQQAMVLELDKKHVRSTLTALEARTGVELQYEDEEARRAEK